MTDYILVTNIAAHLGQEVELKGWVSNLRSSGKISFIEIRDGSGFIQAVANLAQLSEAAKAVAEGLTHESSVRVIGVVTKHPKREEYELQVKSIEVIQRAENYPLGRKEHGPDFLLEHRHLWLRSKSQWAIQRIRNTIILATYEFFQSENFIKIDAPVITGVACEDTTTLFEFEYFDLGKGYLSQSGQLYLEAAIAAHGRVFDFGPVFRAEKSKTRKHLTEFWMMDAEMAFFEHEDNLKLQERLVCHIIRAVLERNRAELVLMSRDISKLEKVSAPFDRITHQQAVEVLRARGSSITEDLDLGANDETLLAQVYDKPLFIERWPTKLKAFYMKRDPADARYVLSADLMAPEGFGELIGGSQREDSADRLRERMLEQNVPLDKMQWYLDQRIYGSVPHSGFGFGLERLVSWISGCEHIRETIPFPRMIYRIQP